VVRPAAPVVGGVGPVPVAGSAVVDLPPPVVEPEPAAPVGPLGAPEPAVAPGGGVPGPLAAPVPWVVRPAAPVVGGVGPVPVAGSAVVDLPPPVVEPEPAAPVEPLGAPEPVVAEPAAPKPTVAPEPVASSGRGPGGSGAFLAAMTAQDALLGRGLPKGVGLSGPLCRTRMLVVRGIFGHSGNCS